MSKGAFAHELVDFFAALPAPTPVGSIPDKTGAWPAGKLETSPKRCAIDNIMTKGFSISEVKVWDRGDLSDHALISARLTFEDKETK